MLIDAPTSLATVTVTHPNYKPTIHSGSILTTYKYTIHHIKHYLSTASHEVQWLDENQRIFGRGQGRRSTWSYLHIQDRYCSNLFCTLQIHSNMLGIVHNCIHYPPDYPLISLATISDQPYRSVSRSGLITSKSYMGLSHTLNNTILKLLSPSPIPAFARSRSVWIRSGSSTDKQIVQDLGILFTICLQILNPTVEMNILT